MDDRLDEARRLDTLRRYAILDTPAEPTFDRIAWIAAAHFRTPIATVTFIDETRQWFKAIYGLGISETARALAFCGHTIAADGVMVVPDAALDPRFCANPLVTNDPHIRFYAGAPLVTRDGIRLGAVSVIDTIPRPSVSAAEERFLVHLAEMVVDDLELRLAAGDVKAEIEERRRIEAELRRTMAEAERANLAKSRFLAAASHDLRQPMQSLVLMLSVLRQRLRHHPTYNVVMSAIHAADVMRGLLDDLLDISRIEAGLVQSQPIAVALGDMLAHLALEYQPRARAKGLDLRLRPCKSAVRTDPVLLERILRNLLENAVRYTEKGGILLACRKRGGRIRVEVYDTGIGVDVQHKEAIFEEFFQLDNPERDRAKGLGLGLAIVRRLAALLDHEVGIVSRPGKGSRFFIELPLAFEEVPAGPVAQTGAPLKGRVLVIDDERMVLEALGVALGGWGLDVVTAETVDQAQESLNGDAPDMILADYRLRGATTGAQAIEQLRQRFNKPIPGLIITGDTSPGRLAEAMSSGYVLLHKPVMPEELHRAVGEILPRS